MLRTIDIKVIYELDDDEYFDSITPPDVVEKIVYKDYISYFADNEGFYDMNVKVNDSYS